MRSITQTGILNKEAPVQGDNLLSLILMCSNRQYRHLRHSVTLPIKPMGTENKED
jgi:hypothetical protein